MTGRVLKVCGWVIVGALFVLPVVLVIEALIVTIGGGS